MIAPHFAILSLTGAGRAVRSRDDRIAEALTEALLFPPACAVEAKLFKV